MPQDDLRAWTSRAHRLAQMLLRYVGMLHRFLHYVITPMLIGYLAVAPAIASAAPRFKRGDANNDGSVQIADPVFTLSYLFRGGGGPACEDAADANDDGAINISDAVFTLDFLFRGGATIPAPGAFVAGEDPTSDTLGCGVPTVEERRYSVNVGIYQNHQHIWVRAVGPDGFGALGRINHDDPLDTTLEIVDPENGSMGTIPQGVLTMLEDQIDDETETVVWRRVVAYLQETAVQQRPPMGVTNPEELPEPGGSYVPPTFFGLFALGFWAIVIIIVEVVLMVLETTPLNVGSEPPPPPPEPTGPPIEMEIGDDESMDDIMERYERERARQGR